MGFPTSETDSTMAVFKALPSSLFLEKASTSTIPASTIVPMAMAIPPRDIMLELTPMWFMSIKVPRREITKKTTTAKLRGRFRRKTAITRITTTDSSMRTLQRCFIALSISSDRS